MRDRPLTLEAPDVQAQAPSLAIGLSRVGVTGVEKVIRIRQDGAEQLFWARLECFVDLGPDQKGAHMSRFEEVVNEAIGEVVLGESTFRAENLAQRIAELVRDRQGALRAEVTIAARYPEHKPAPVSGVDTQEIYTLFGMAVATERGTRRLVGVAAQGMTACPCAQQLVGAARARAAARRRASASDEIERIFDAVPRRDPQPARPRHAATSARPRARRSRSTRRTLLAIVEDSMSSEIYELMKRVDEVAVVEKAHRRPRFVEDCVREMIGGVRRAARRRSPTTRSCRRARRTSRRSTSTTCRPSATARSASCARSSRAASRSPRHTTLREWLDV